MKLIIRADDFGFSEAVNCGELAALKTGLVKSIGLMVNMPAANQAVQIANCFPEVALGLHANLVIGKPVADLDKVHSLVQKTGNFISSREYRKELETEKEVFKDKQALEIEIEAQILRFYHLTGRLPEYIDTHAVHSENLFKVVKSLAEKYHLLFLATDSKFNTNLNQNPVRLASSSAFYQQGGDPRDYIKKIGEEILKKQKPISYIVVHPGYLDDDVFAKSSFTQIRTHDVAMLKSDKTKKWLEHHHIELTSHRALKGME